MLSFPQTLQGKWFGENGRNANIGKSGFWGRGCQWGALQFTVTYINIEFSPPLDKKICVLGIDLALGWHRLETPGPVTYIAYVKRLQTLCNF